MRKGRLPQLPRLPDLHILPKLEWRPLELPKRMHSFIWSRANLFISLAAALVVYMVLIGQPELIRRAMAVFVFAAFCWLLEVFPYPITGLMVPVACALTGVLGPAASFAPFGKEVVFIMIGALVLSEGVKRHKLDRRLALYVLQKSEGDVDRLLLLFMVTIGFLAMWMTITATVLVLLPTVMTVIAAMPKDQPNIAKKLLIGLAISSAIGAMGMLSGTPPNLIAADALSQQQGGFSFLQWAYYALPISLASLGIAYLMLRWLFPTRKTSLDLSAIEKQRKELGPMTAQQTRTVAIFGLTMALFVVGENVERLLGLPPSLSSAAVVSILSVLMMFGAGLLKMDDIRAMRFDLIFLIGGGLVLGEALLGSGSASMIGGWIASAAGGMPFFMLMLLFIFLTVLLTNFMSNTATAAIMVPIALMVSKSYGVGPAPLVLATGLASSIAFLTPVGTPSTAIIYSMGGLDKKDLFKAGIITALLMAVIIALYLELVPEWGSL